MSILNYSQPDFYHFNQDSTSLARYVIKKLGDCNEKIRALDLCAGCGVIGIEINRSLPNIQFDFCEIQNDFKKHLSHNLENLASSWGQVYIGNYQDFSAHLKYDLIVCNPPYFNCGEGRLPEDSRRQNCKFFQEGTMNSLLAKIEGLLTLNGTAYLVSPQMVQGMTPVVDLVRAKIFKVSCSEYR